MCQPRDRGPKINFSIRGTVTIREPYPIDLPRTTLGQPQAGSVDLKGTTGAKGGHLNSEPTVHFDPSVFLSTPGEGLVIKKYDNGAVIFAQGDAAQDIFYIQAGQVKISVVSDLGKEAVIGILSADHFLGEAALNGQRIRLSSATAIEDCTIVQLSREETLRILEKEPKFSEFFIQHLLSRNLRIEEDLVDQLFNSSEKRLARILLVLANFGKEGKPETVIPDITQATLAEMVGTTRSRVSFFMNKFRKLGFIEYNGKLQIHSSLLNVVLHD
jgi:CRP/FNR family transcriptional regulator, cyclic AMP receptor protein